MADHVGRSPKFVTTPRPPASAAQANARARLQEDPLLQRLRRDGDLGLSHDPWLAHMRRVSRAAGMTTTIADSTSELRDKLHATAPPAFHANMHTAMRGAPQMVRLQPVQQSMTLRPAAPMNRESSATCASPRLDCAEEAAAFVTAPTPATVKDEAGVAPIPPSTARPSAPPSSHTRIRPATAAPMAAPRSPPTSGSASSLWPSDAGGRKMWKDHSTILSRVIASAERLELEYAALVTSSTSDTARGIEAARNETLRAHVASLRDMGARYEQLLKRSEAKAQELTRELESARRENARRRREATRLRFALAQGHTGEVTEKVAIAFMASSDSNSKRLMQMAEQAAARERVAYEKQLEDATSLADTLASKLSTERQQTVSTRELHEKVAERKAKEDEAMQRKIEKLEPFVARSWQLSKKLRQANETLEKLVASRNEALMRLGSIGDGGVLLDANGKIVLDADGNPVKITDPRVPPGGSIGIGGLILDKNGCPVIPPGGWIRADGVMMDGAGHVVRAADGSPMRVIDRRIPVGGSIGDGGIILGADGEPVLGADGKPMYITDPRGSVGAGGYILDKDGNVVLGDDGLPLIAFAALGAVPPGVPPGGSIRADGVLIDASGNPLLAADGSLFRVTDRRVPTDGSIGEGGLILDAEGNPVLGADGQLMYITDPRVPLGGSIGAGGIILDAKGIPVLGDDGMALIAYSAMGTAMPPGMDMMLVGVPTGGSIRADGAILTADGVEILAADGSILRVTDGRIPLGGSIGEGGLILDAEGNPVLGADGQPMYVVDHRVPPGGWIGAGGVLRNADGSPVLGEDGLPLIAYAAIGAGLPPGGSIRNDGVILDAEGEPVLDAEGEPLRVTDRRIPIDGTVGEGGIILDGNGQPVLGEDGQPMFIADPRTPPGGSIGAGGYILDKDGNVVLGADGMPLVAYAAMGAVPPFGSIRADGCILDEDGNPILTADGSPLTVTDCRCPVGGSIGEGGLILDAEGNPVLGADGKRMYITDPRVPLGGSIGAGGIILDAKGIPLLGDDGLPLIAFAAMGISRAGTMPPGVPPGGSVRGDGVILAADGMPVLGEDGTPLTVTDSRIPVGGSIGEGGIILDSAGNPVLDANGQQMYITDDPRLPPGGKIGAGGVLLNADGSPVLGSDGTPLIAYAAMGVSSSSPGRRPKAARTVNTVPAGRLVTLSRLRARDVPDVDLRGGDKNLSDPYLILTLVDKSGLKMDETRTPAIDNTRSPIWKGLTLRLFMPDDNTSSSRTAPVSLRITLMDANKRKSDTFIGEVTTSLAVGSRQLKVEVPSRSVSMARPFVLMHYEVLPQMFYEQTEWKRVSAEEDARKRKAAGDGGGDEDDGEYETGEVDDTHGHDED